MAENRDIDLANIRDELDNLAIKILKIMQNIILERQYLDDNLREGFINMAKSRYLIKERKIGMHQINTSNLSASKKVISDTDIDEKIKFTSFHIFDKKKSESTCKESHSDTESPYARNSKTVNSKIEKNFAPKEDLQNNLNDEFESLKNPLNWFGVLVPNTLKTCQCRFEQALETSAKIVTLQDQLKALSEEYRRLRKQKSLSVT